MRRPNRNYFVYILASWNRILYTGITNDLSRRINQHERGEGSVFAKKYKAHRLVYFEIHNDIRAAIAREKEIKGWRREKKVRLVEQVNPAWDDLLVPRNY